MDYDEEDFVFYGTPIEREEELTSRKKKALAESSGNLRSLPSWKQEVRDEEGRRRFHGAFTGGYSAGYYNTVGSKEGWAPRSFTSSRKNRAEVKQQSILNFLDEDEKAELEGRSVSTSSQFDTFGFTAAELARKQAEKEQQQRPSAIPGPVPDEIVLPVTESVGVKLLKRMGWRQGHSIDESHVNSLYDARREARKAFLALMSEESKPESTENEPVEVGFQNLQELTMDNDASLPKSTPIYVLNPKQDLHGLGYDPYKNAPEFREKKRLLTSGRGQGRMTFSTKEPTRDNLFGFRTRNVAPGFGIGALEELDAEDEDVYAPGYDLVDTSIEEVDEPSRLKSDLPDRPRLTAKDHGILHGFKLASKTDYQLERFDPPVIPKDFEPHHKFPGPLEIDHWLSDPPPPEALPPEDNYLKILIDGVAALVARCGKLFEDLSREKNQSNPFYSFLNGGSFSDYYTRKLWEERQKRYQTKLELEEKLPQNVPPITAESRGRILGERPLERSSIAPSSSNATMNVKPQTNLLDTFAKPAVSIELLESSKPFKDDPAKQKRFEQFIKEKYHGGLWSTSSGGASSMSEAERAHERLDFEAAVEEIERGQWGKEANKSAQRPIEFSATGALQFTSSGMKEVESKQAEDLAMKNMYPKREEFTWRPSPVLCKRFDLMDPYMGKLPPAPRMRSKMDSLLFMADSAIPTQMEESVGTKKSLIHLPQTENVESSNANDKEPEVQVEAENIERPVDLYKAIFSDDSDDEEETSAVNKMTNSGRKVEVANATLNRLIAGDFLESLGKELGLEVPPDRPPPMDKASIQTQKEAACSNAESANTLTIDGVLFPSHAPQSGSSQSHYQEEATKEGIHDSKHVSSVQRDGSSNITAASERKYSGHDINDMPHENKKSRIKSDHHESWGSSSSEDERSRRSSKKHRYSSDSDSYSLRDYREQSKGRKKGSSHEKRHSRRRESKRRKHRERDSPSRSRHRKEERHEAKRYKERSRD